LRRGFGGGSQGSINAHSSSSMIGVPIPLVPVVQMAKANSLPKRLTSPFGVFLKWSLTLYSMSSIWAPSSLRAPNIRLAPPSFLFRCQYPPIISRNPCSRETSWRAPVRADVGFDTATAYAGALQVRERSQCQRGVGTRQ
jgi:hypothetical protein